MNVPTVDHPRAVDAFQRIRLLERGYLGISLLALVAIVAMRNNSAEVNSAVWIRGIVVVATALLLLTFSARAARGSRSAFWRLRIVSVITPIAILLIIALPGTFPLWMKIEQGICGAVMIGVAALANGRELRSQFARHESSAAALPSAQVSG